jgi:uncharacterized membrane protein
MRFLIWFFGGPPCAISSGRYHTVEVVPRTELVWVMMPSKHSSVLDHNRVYKSIKTVHTKGYAVPCISHGEFEVWLCLGFLAVSSSIEM